MSHAGGQQRHGRMHPKVIGSVVWLSGGFVGISAAAMLSQAPADAALYAPLFAATYHAHSALGLVVRDTSVSMPTLKGASPNWLKQFDDVPVALRRAASRTEPTRVRSLDVKSLPAGVRTVPAQATRAIVASGTGEAWEAFKRQYNANGWLAFSDPVFAPTGLDALVYYEAECGGLCGETGYAWLQRDSAQLGWRLKKKIVKRMS